MFRKFSGTSLLMLFLLAFVVILLADSRQNSAPVRLFPLLVGIPTGLGLLLLFLAEWSGWVRSIVARFGGIQLVNMEEITREFQSSSQEQTMEDDVAEPRMQPAIETSNKTSERSREIQISLWLAAYVTGIGFLGFLAATLIFLPAFWIFQARERPLPSLLLTAATLAFVYILFMRLLRLPLDRPLF